MKWAFCVVLKGAQAWAALRSPAKSLTFSGSNGNYHQTQKAKGMAGSHQEERHNLGTELQWLCAQLRTLRWIPALAKPTPAMAASDTSAMRMCAKRERKGEEANKNDNSNNNKKKQKNNKKKRKTKTGCSPDLGWRSQCGCMLKFVGPWPFRPVDADVSSQVFAKQLELGEVPRRWLWSQSSQRCRPLGDRGHPEGRFPHKWWFFLAVARAREGDME